MSHAFYSPSASSRWMSCTASLTIDTSSIKRKSSPAADLGTALHEAGELLLAKKKTFKSIVGHRAYAGIEITKDHVSSILKPYYDFVIDQCNVNEHKHVIRYELHLETRSVFLDGVYGTADVVIVQYHPDKTVTIKVIDLKTGSGEAVSPIDNSQLLIYASGVYLDQVLLHHEISRIEIGICQPPFNIFSMVRISEKDLLTFHDKVRRVVESVEAGDVKFVASESNCKWCDAKTICPELNKVAQHAAAQDFSKLAKASKSSLSEKMKMAGILKQWIAAVEAEVSARFAEGGRVPGFKLVAGRGSRAWAEEDLARRKEVFRENKIPVKLLMRDPEPASPNQVETALKKLGKDPAVVSSLIIAREGAPTVVPENDKRDEWSASKDQKAAADFANSKK